MSETEKKLSELIDRAPSELIEAIRRAAEARHPVVDATRYCRLCGAAEQCHWPGGSRYNACVGFEAR